ncbi:MAG TPA: hypothetical protein VGJ20_43600 [Xanthobacteraceae bacterium]
MRGPVGFACGVDLGDIDVARVGVDVSVDEARHHGSAADIDHLRIFGLGDGGRNLPDRARFHEYLLSLGTLFVPAVENSGIFQ